MKDTKPPRETVSSLNYRDTEETPTATAPDLISLSTAALDFLARDGAAAEPGGNPDQMTWAATAVGPDGINFDVRCAGPDLPRTIPDETAHPSVIPYERPWLGTYRLTVRAPLVVCKLSWRPGEPLRIMGFSRGDWEESLTALAPQ